jgi:hypothetical protein
MLGSPAANTPEFRQAFVRKCHRLVGQAYLSLDRASLQAAEETEITGELARSMEELLDVFPLRAECGILWFSMIPRRIQVYGLQMYIRGEYAAEQDEAGMLGYVQTNEPAAWANQLSACLKEKPADHAVHEGGEWSPCSITSELLLTFRSVHNRLSIGRFLTVFHTLLEFR